MKRCSSLHAHVLWCGLLGAFGLCCYPLLLDDTAQNLGERPCTCCAVPCCFPMTCLLAHMALRTMLRKTHSLEVRTPAASMMSWYKLCHSRLLFTSGVFSEFHAQNWLWWGNMLAAHKENMSSLAWQKVTQTTLRRCWGSVWAVKCVWISVSVAHWRFWKGKLALEKCCLALSSLKYGSFPAKKIMPKK